MAKTPLVLVGMSGVGKSHWAKRLVSLGFTRHDCDSEIAARVADLAPPRAGEDPVHALGRWMGMPWTEGREARESRYLALEEEVTRAALSSASAAERPSRHVIDTTGSVVHLPEALRAELAERAFVLYLRAPEAHRADLLARYERRPKPIVWGSSWTPDEAERPQDALPRCYARLLAERDRRYAHMASQTMDATEISDLEPEAFLARISFTAVA